MDSSSACLFPCRNSYLLARPDGTEEQPAETTERALLATVGIPTGIMLAKEGRHLATSSNSNLGDLATSRNASGLCVQKSQFLASL